MAIKPLADRVVAQKSAPEQKTKSGILLGEAKEKPNYAEVTATGKDVKEIKKGDRILFREYSATDVTVDGKDYIVIKEEDVLATL
ncbi:co-chaperone GroES [Candidatus Saccharibacteria bacterium]|nr:co-chaperone GroES [Candidatus Saccharibacteria bacterium]